MSKQMNYLNHDFIYIIPIENDMGTDYSFFQRMGSNLEL